MYWEKKTGIFFFSETFYFFFAMEKKKVVKKVHSFFLLFPVELPFHVFSTSVLKLVSNILHILPSMDYPLFLLRQFLLSIVVFVVVFFVVFSS